jgi:hypothetical protein
MTAEVSGASVIASPSPNTTTAPKTYSAESASMRMVSGRSASPEPSGE